LFLKLTEFKDWVPKDGCFFITLPIWVRNLGFLEGGFVRRILFALFLCFPSFVEATDTTVTPSEKPKIGQGVADFNATASSTAKTGMYFMAGLLLAFGVWKKFYENKTTSPKKLISIVSRTVVGPRAGLLVAEVEGERFLLSHTPDCISLIAKLNSAGFDQVLEEELTDETV